MSPSEAQLGASKVSIRMVTDSTVLMDWESHSSAMQKSTIRMIMHPNSNVTTIQWQFVQELHWYPWEKLGSFMNDKILGPMMEQNLLNLKKLVEHQ
jgi:thiamine kinase-like enzyme